MITQPMDFNEAIGSLLDKDQVPASWDSAHWALMAPEARIRAFFSAKVENARFLDRAQGLLFDYMAKVRDDTTTEDGEKTTKLRVAGRADFVEQMTKFMIEEGMAKPEEFRAMNQNDVQTIGSTARLRLIFDTNVRQAYGYGQWKQSMTPEALAAFPAARLVRRRGVTEARPRHAASIGQVRAKTDFYWWASFQNSPEIGGFGVPWGPYGFNSGVDQENVPREEAAALGVAIPPPPAELPGLNDGLSASTRKMSPALKAKLLAELRGGPKPADPREAARQAAAQVRREMLNRGLTDALGKGDAAKVERYREALAVLPPVGLPVREEAEKIVLETAPAAVIVPALPNENRPYEDQSKTHDLPNEGQEVGADEKPDARATAEAIRAASRDVYPGWTIPQGDRDQGSVAERAIEAHIAAAAEGRKPMYFEPWGNPEIADKFASAYRMVLPEQVAVESKSGMVFVYRPAVVGKILDSDPDFYRLPGESDLDSIVRVSGDAINGELLGYGARSMTDRPAHEVKIFKGGDMVLYFFVSSPDVRFAEKIASERADDFVRAFGWDDVGFELTKVD